ncbi:MAG: transglycosylase SLT domain-containing protein [Thermoanaerobaculia bacterium]|nr:transglycosylase SLT domain-containing protein [Thermoanaerobaculia bacterium]
MQELRTPPRLPDAVRKGEWDRARELLVARADSGDPGAELARTLLGLAAHDAGRFVEARRLLDRPPQESPGLLDDWALWTLSDCLITLDEPRGAQETLAALSRRHSDSSLADRGRLRSLELALETGRVDLARRRIEEGRARRLPGRLSQALERGAWELALREGDRRGLEEAGRRLAAFHPSAARELGVRERLGLSAEGSWGTLLTSEETESRARILLDRGEVEDALVTLESVDPADRTPSWPLLAAEARIAQKEGFRALALLAPLVPESREEQARVAWLRSRAFLAAPRADPRSQGDRELRRADREQALRLLRRAADLTEDPRLETEVLGRLFHELASDERIDEALEIRRRILALDPDSSVGRRLLWSRSWKAMEERNFADAIHLFTELSGDPARQDRWSRGARYWIARSWEEMGHRHRAERAYRALAETDVSDFYRHHALRRLGRSSPAPSGSAAAPSWPTDPSLARARFLSDVGLDALALRELEDRRAEADPRAAAALQALILARGDDPRSSMAPLRRAFPEVATPVQARVPRTARELYYPLRHREAVVRWAQSRDLPPALVFAVVRQESAFDVRARSRAGARGLMQMMPATARELAGKLGIPFSGERLYDPDYSLRLGTRYLRDVLEMFDGDVELALAGYNGGPYRIKRWWRQAAGRVDTDRFIDGLPLSESRAYVHRILLLSDSYARLYGLPGAAASPPAG